MLADEEVVEGGGGVLWDGVGGVEEVEEEEEEGCGIGMKESGNGRGGVLVLGVMEVEEGNEAMEVEVLRAGVVEVRAWLWTWRASGHCNTGTVAFFSVGDVKAEKSNAVVGRSGETTGGGRGGY